MKQETTKLLKENELARKHYENEALCQVHQKVYIQMKVNKNIRIQ